MSDFICKLTEPVEVSPGRARDQRQLTQRHLTIETWSDERKLRHLIEVWDRYTPEQIEAALPA